MNEIRIPSQGDGGGADQLDFPVHKRAGDLDFSYHRNILVENNRFLE